MKPVVHERVVAQEIGAAARSEVKDMGVKVEHVGTTVGGIVSDVVSGRRAAPELEKQTLLTQQQTTTATTATASALKPKLLIVLTSSAPTISGRTTGWFWSEVYEPYMICNTAGYDCDFVSLTGHAELDQSSISRQYGEEGYKAYNDKNHRIHGALKHIMKPNDINLNNYCGIYFAGGHGGMWDFPSAVPLHQLAAQIYANGGLVAAVCHGTCALGGIKLNNGQPLVAGRRVTGFSTKAEESMGYLDELTHKYGLRTTEQMMRDAGAQWVEPKDPMAEWIVEDGRLITGSNPASSRGVGLKIVNQLKHIAPVALPKATTSTEVPDFNKLKEQRTTTVETERTVRKERI